MTTLFCPAKVNLYLAILGRDSSGYHFIDTVFSRVPQLYDVLEIEPAKELTFECALIPGEQNTVMRAVRLLEKKFARHFAYKIRLTKNIPPQSGLGGGSSDAGAALLHLNEVENLGLSHDELMQLGAEIGMDVPFFLSGYTVARGTHYGEQVEQLPALAKQISIGFTNIPISTKQAFSLWDQRGLKSTAPAYFPNILHNDFEQLFPDLSFKKPTTVLSGSGGAYALIHSYP